MKASCILYNLAERIRCAAVTHKRCSTMSYIQMILTTVYATLRTPNAWIYASTHAHICCKHPSPPDHARQVEYCEETGGKCVVFTVTSTKLNLNSASLAGHIFLRPYDDSFPATKSFTQPCDRSFPVESAPCQTIASLWYLLYDSRVDLQ